MDERRSTDEANDERRLAIDELGRRIFATLLSYEMNLNSIDYTLKTYVGKKEEIHPSWGELGFALLKLMHENSADQKLGPAVRSLTNQIQ